jgi:hypothetical protein
MVGRATFLAALTATLLAGGGCNTILGIGAHALAPATNDGSVDADATVDGHADDAGTVSSCSSGGWCSTFTSSAQPSSLLATWGSAWNDVWAIGDGGQILHWNGSTWLRTRDAPDQSLRAIWGSGPHDVWAVGHNLAGFSGLVLHWDGKAWTTFDSGTIQPLTGVWASGNGDAVVVVASSGAILRCDRATEKCSLDANPMPLSFVDYGYSGVWGSGSADIWAVGARGIVVHWDGHAWSDFTSKSRTTQPLNHVWGTGPKDVWAVGDGGTIDHWNGYGWALTTVGLTLHDLKSVSGPPGATPLNDAWAVGADGTILRLSNGAWVDAHSTSVATQTLDGVWANAPNDAWAVGDGDVIIHWDGTAWSEGAPRNPNVVKAIWGAGPRDVWTVGDASTIAHWDGTHWFNVSYGSTTLSEVPLNRVWGSGSDDVWAVGNKSDQGDTILHWNGHAWCVLYSGLCATASGTPIPSPTGVPYDLSGVWASGPNDVWAVGIGGTVLHWTGGPSWSETKVQTPDGQLNAVWSNGPNADVWVVGGSGTILRWSYTTMMWTDEPTRNLVNQAAINGVWGGPKDVWFVGDGETILRWQEGQWSNLTNPTGNPSPQSLLSIWGSGTTNVWAVGNGGTVLHLTDSVGTWTVSPSGTSKFFDGVWGSGPGDVWVVGEDGVILHH